MDDRTTTVKELRDTVARFVDERDWAQFHDPKNLVMSIAIEAAELMEHFQWWRSDELDAALEKEGVRKEIEEELADILCYVLSFANRMEIDIARAVAAKVAKNARKYPAAKYRGKFE
jgi:NTP pyrophosphatase (non-canonical NTP hydrolase)